MTQPRLFYTLAAQHAEESTGILRRFFSFLGHVSPRTSVPTGAIVFTTAASLAALGFFASFSRLVNFSTVPLQVAVIFMVVMAAFVVSAVVFRPVEPVIGMALGATGGLVYWRLRKGGARS